MTQRKVRERVMQDGQSDGRSEAEKGRGGSSLATRPQGFSTEMSGRSGRDGLTVHVVSVDFLGACTFVAFWDDLTPPGLVLLLADILVKQTI